MKILYRKNYLLLAFNKYNKKIQIFIKQSWNIYFIFELDVSGEILQLSIEIFLKN